jgi:3-hydroxymyristoyl/3-hydroxydecanoyl-(acyl carrier protein) dehydratase
MVDRVLALEKGKKIVAIKNITGNEILVLRGFRLALVMPKESPRRRG